MRRVIKSTNARIDNTRPVIITAHERDFEDEGPAVQLEAELRLKLEAEFEEERGRLLSAAREEAGMLLEEARLDAERIRSACEAECGGVRADAQSEGYAEGLRQAEEEMTAYFAKAQEDVDAFMNQAYAERDGMLEECEPKILKMSLDIAEKILNMQLDRNDTAFMSMIQNAMASIKAEKKVVLHVNTGEYVRFFKAHDVNIQTADGNVAATVLNDSTVESYGCLIEAESGVVDAGLKAQLSQVASGFGIDWTDENG